MITHLVDIGDFKEFILEYIETAERVNHPFDDFHRSYYPNGFPDIQDLILDAINDCMCDDDMMFIKFYYAYPDCTPLQDIVEYFGNIFYLEYEEALEYYQFFKIDFDFNANIAFVYGGLNERFID